MLHSIVQTSESRITFSYMTRPCTSTPEISFSQLKYIIVIIIIVVIIITNILTLEINTVHILHYDTIIYTVLYAAVGPIEYHIL